MSFSLVYSAHSLLPRFSLSSLRLKISEPSGARSLSCVVSKTAPFWRRSSGRRKPLPSEERFLRGYHHMFYRGMLLSLTFPSSSPFTESCPLRVLEGLMAVGNCLSERGLCMLYFSVNQLCAG